jgi:hypothetical protein
MNKKTIIVVSLIAVTILVSGIIIYRKNKSIKVQPAPPVAADGDTKLTMEQIEQLWEEYKDGKWKEAISKNNSVKRIGKDVFMNKMEEKKQDYINFVLNKQNI